MDHQFGLLPSTYAYLLGLYLGDGCISPGRRQVYRLRVSLDARYPGIIDECAHAIHAIAPRNRVGRLSHDTWIVVYSYSKCWPCFFPQHGPGMKHQRRIELLDWQRTLVRWDPELLLRGLIHSDGCRFTNTGTNWICPRYAFSNASDDIRRIFCDACDLLGVRYTFAPRTVYVSRKTDVEVLDRFIGPK